ncbi:MAG: peptidoglycan DD-metalloendopeptidase family protein [Candidatus Pacebacteria bacterium]|nr:peptidoglycan DD-metalloendopeptidase family protein [Candidatus Paceibacterota bacterium]
MIIPTLVVFGLCVPNLAGFAFLNQAEASFFGRGAIAETPVYESIQTLSILEARSAPGQIALGGPEISIDDNALVPELGAAGTAMDVYEIPTSDLITIYIVRTGDSLAGIANMFDVSPNTIRWANNMGPKDSVRVGQELVILPVTGVRHTVKKGDTITSIAKKYGGDAEDIAGYNGVGIGDALALGDIVIIPDGEVSVVTTSTSSGKKTTSVIAKTSASGAAPSSGYYIKPTNGRLTQGFHGPYQAIDVGAPIGTPIYAAAAGRVIVSKSSGYNGGYGLMVIIQHDNGSQTLYAHMSKVFAKVGQKVSQGEQIGAMGSTGRSTGSHLHFEVRGVKTPILYAGSAK